MGLGFGFLNLIRLQILIEGLFPALGLGLGLGLEVGLRLGLGHHFR